MKGENPRPSLPPSLSHDFSKPDTLFYRWSLVLKDQRLEEEFSSVRVGLLVVCW